MILVLIVDTVSTTTNVKMFGVALKDDGSDAAAAASITRVGNNRFFTES